MAAEDRVSWLDKVPKPGENNVWYSDVNQSTAFVFVHGIFSDSRKCWLHQDTNRGASCYWPQLVLDDRRLGSPSVFLAGFYTDVDSKKYDHVECAAEMFAALGRTDDKLRPPVLARHNIIFVCHSTGGIVARYLLERNASAFKDHHVGLVLIASPSYGSQWANRLGGLAAFYSNELGFHLKLADALLKELDDRFKELLDAKRIPRLDGIEACEHHFIVHRRWLPDQTLVVERESAGRYFGRTRILRNTDHFSAVKPAGFHHPAHELLVDFYAAHFGVAFEKRLAARLERSKAEVRSRDLPYQTPVLLDTLLYNGSLGAFYLDEIRPGLSTEICAQLRRWLEESLPKAPGKFSDFEWSERGDVREARAVAERENAPFIVERHLLLGVLRGRSNTAQQLRELLGDGFTTLLRRLENPETGTGGEVFGRR